LLHLNEYESIYKTGSLVVNEQLPKDPSKVLGREFKSQRFQRWKDGPRDK
jgi:hypothetical protein